MKTIGTILTFLSLFLGVNAQVFSPERVKFAREFQAATQASLSADQAKVMKNEIVPFLSNASMFNDKILNETVVVANRLIEKKLSAYPDVYNYIYSVYSLSKNKQSEQNIIGFQTTIDKLLASKNPKRFSEFAEASATFFENSMLVGKSNFEWYYLGGDFLFKYEDKPMIQFQNGTLVCKAIESGSNQVNKPAIDSIVVYQTSGIYDPTLQKWEGSKGTIDWTKVGLSKSETFAELSRYSISFKTSEFRADSVLLTTPYFKEKIPGRLAERAFKIIRKDDRQYPQFVSYNTNHVIPNLKPNLDYKGGFALKGAQFNGTGNAQGLAQITLMVAGKPTVLAKSQEIFINEDRIYAIGAKTSILLHSGDSIVHPGLNFDYFYKEGRVEFSRTNSGTGQSPFRDSYLKLEFYVQKLVFNEKEQKLMLTYEKGTGQEQRLARLESFDYFDGKVFEQVSGLSTTNPLVALDKFTYNYDEFYITEGKCATALGGTLSQVKPLMLELANLGFINYDTDKQMVFITPKVSNFVRSKAGKKDYDNITFVTDFKPKEFRNLTAEELKQNPALQQMLDESKVINTRRRTLENFGVYDLINLSLSLFEVDQVPISDHQKVVVFPSDGKVVVYKNRDFQFNGWVNAGKMEINVTNGRYDYAQNTIQLKETEKSIIRAQPRKAEHGKYGIPTTSSFTGLLGELKVDLPTNRSGLLQQKESAAYPILEVKNKTKVFYNYPELFKGAYDSTRFYYSLEPFTLDSLDNFNDVAFRLKGKLVSAGIFPDLSEDLRIMPDYSFGFSTTAPASGIDFYTTAKYANKIMLSNNGLQGAGTINFQHSTSISKDLLTFLPDSTLGTVKFTNLAVATGVEFPQVTSEDAYMVYVPKAQKLKVYSTKVSDLNFFAGEATLKGYSEVTPKGMTGRGVMAFNTAKVVSNQFVYKHKDIFADTANFNIANNYREEGENELAFDTKNVTTKVSFKDRKGEFRSNQGTSEVRFPINQYLCKSDQFVWWMDKEQIELKKENKTKVGDVKSNFFSTHPQQDSLQFNAPLALFKLKEKTIVCNEVPYIDVADSRVFPDSLKVVIRKKAVLDPFVNAEILANNITKHHKFKKANVSITSRKAYAASGEYIYFDKDSLQTHIVMQDIKPGSDFVTRAEGVIEKDRSFKLNDKFDYYGKIKVVASSPEIFFDGATRIQHNCTNLDRNWLAFASAVDPKNVQIPVSQTMKNLDGEAISAGVVWHDSPVVDSIQLYPTFLSKLLSPADPIVSTANGYLTFDEVKKEFVIASKEKIVNRALGGNLLTLNTETCNVYGEGVIQLGMDHGDLKVETVGTVNYDQRSNETRFNLTARFNFPMDKGMMKDLAEKINAADLKPMEFNLMNTMKMAMLQWTNVETANKTIEEYTAKNEVKRSPLGSDAAIVLSGIHLKAYNSTQNNFKGLVSTTESAILVSMFDKPVMKYVTFKSFFQQKYSVSGGDWFALLIDIPGGKDYFFNYSMNKKDAYLDILSSDSEFVSAITGMKDDKRKTKNFLYQLGQSGQRQVFYNLFER